MLNQSLTLQPSSEGKHEYLEQKAFCIKIGKAKQLQEKTWPQDGTGCSSLEGNFTQAAPNSQRSAKETARQEKPSLPPARAQRDPKSISCSAPAPRGPSNLQPGVGKQRDGQQGSQGSRTGVPGCAEEAGAKRVSPGVNLACTRQPRPGSGLCGLLLTPSERGSSPLLWPEEYRLTYSPSPASSLAFSL